MDPGTIGLVLEILGRVTVALEQMAKPKRWEYLSGDGRRIDKDAMGDQGWELVGAWDGETHFKRELRE